jgi:CBS domain containing-hemolysin-like protein
VKVAVLDWVLHIIGLLSLLGIHGLLVACESSLVKIRFSHFNRELRDAIDASRSLSAIVEKGDRSTRTLRIGSSLSSIVYVVLLLSLAARWMGPDGLALNGIAFLGGIGGILAVGLFLYHALAEVAPRSLGFEHPLSALRAGSWLLPLMGALTAPFRWLSIEAVSIGWRIFHKSELPDIDSLDLETQIQEVREESPEMSVVAQLILKNTLLMRELVVSDVLLPRNQVKYFDLNLPLSENLQMAKETGHTRFPLCFGDLDRCLGLIHIKDIFRYPGDPARLDPRRIKRNMIRIDSEEPLEEALTKLLSHRMHMALVIDEFHGTEGVLTLERILEQIVGEIRDEFDADEEVLIKSDHSEETAVVSGLTPLHEIEGLFDTELENEDVSTVGGLITSELGEIPPVGASLKHAGLEFSVTEVDETRVLEVRIIRTEGSETESEKDPADEGETR